MRDTRTFALAGGAHSDERYVVAYKWGVFLCPDICYGERPGGIYSHFEISTNSSGQRFEL